MDELWYTITKEITYPLDFAAPLLVLLYLGIALAIAALVAVAVRPAGGDPYFSLMKAAIPGCVVLLLLANNPQAFRLELVFLPIAAVGLAVLAERAVGIAQRRRWVRWPPGRAATLG
jgi:hypothetical protein